MPAMDGSSGHKRPLKVIVETRKRSYLIVVLRVVAVTVACWYAALLPMPLALIVTIALNVLNALAE